MRDVAFDVARDSNSTQEYESIYKASLAIAAFPPQQRVVSRRKREDDDEDADEIERYALF